MSLIGPWTRLKGLKKRSPYYALFNSNGAGYKLVVTDLRQMWEEECDEACLRSKAAQFNCPVDPTLPGQGQALVKHLMDTIYSMRSMEMQLDADSLTLTTHEPLSSGDQLDWTYTLAWTPMDLSGLIYTLMQNIIAQKRYSKQLEHDIALKDYHIRAMLDERKRLGLNDYLPARHPEALTPHEHIHISVNYEDIRHSNDMIDMSLQDMYSVDSTPETLDQSPVPTSTSSGGRKKLQSVVTKRKRPDAEAMIKEMTDKPEPEVKKEGTKRKLNSVVAARHQVKQQKSTTESDLVPSTATAPAPEHRKNIKNKLKKFR
ncbi:hypothetical protein CANCADRAFT_134076 [Tortispora caseinolytica NRRL Y-17796]|uniref:Non-homologous end-joining factor 1 n=1 Tax=Tortispora caseinolytica NRRL Y-17796 TaxID=767744 RepID=A0A1E4TBK9_9ASCO|nr:hypothetical protein CANCADRAFT_134076 [Tortispora caseinolytica NRRL Y-17796]